MPQKNINAVIYRDNEKLNLINLVTEKKSECHFPLLMTFQEGGPIAETTIALVEIDSNNKITCHAGVHLFDKNDVRLTVKKLSLDEIIDVAYRAILNFKKQSLGA